MRTVERVFGVERYRRECKMSSSKKIDLWRDFASGVYLSEAQSPVPPPPYKLYTCIQYTYSHREGGGESWTSENGATGESTVRKFGWKYQHDWMYVKNWLSPVYKLWYTPAAKSLLQVIFLDDDILRWLLWVLSFYGLWQKLKFTVQKKNHGFRQTDI